MDLIKFNAPHGPAWVFFGVFVVVIVGPWLAERIHVPGLVGLLIGGLVIGPHGLAIIEEADSTIPSLGQLGLLYLMFLAGLELDLDVFSKHRNTALGFAALTFGVPMVCGYVSGVLLGYATAAALLLGSLWASHTLITYPTLRRYGIAAHPAVAATVGATIITDTLSLVVLAGVAGSTTGDASGIDLFSQIVLGLLALMGFCWVLLPRIAAWFFPRLGQQANLRYVFVLAAFLSAAVVAEVFGIEGIVGAFFAGLALNRLVPNGGPLMERIEFFGSAVLIPIFLISVGLIIDPGVMADPGTLGLAAVFILACLGGKAVAAAACKPLYGYSWAEVGTVYSLSAAQAAATLAATFVGYDIGLIGTSVVNAVLIVIVVSLLLASFMATLCGPRVQAPPVDTSRLGRTVLLPVDRHDAPGTAPTARMAARLAGADGGVVLPLIVVSGGGHLDPNVVEDVHHAMVLEGIDSEVLLRVDRSRADAVAHTASGEEATLVVVPIDPPGLQERLFGAQEDRLVRASPSPVLLVALAALPERVILVDRPARSPSAQLARTLAVRMHKAGFEVVVLTRAPDPELRTVLGDDVTVEIQDDLIQWAETHAEPTDAFLVAAQGRWSVMGADASAFAALPRHPGLMVVASHDAAGASAGAGPADVVGRGVRGTGGLSGRTRRPPETDDDET